MNDLLTNTLNVESLIPQTLMLASSFKQRSINGM
jgi:hypothetical protein